MYLPKIKYRERPSPYYLLSDLEIDRIITWGTHLMQHFHKFNGFRSSIATLIEQQTQSIEQTTIEEPTEYCFMMNELRWNIHEKHPCTLCYHQPTNQLVTMERIFKASQDFQHIWVGDSGASCHFTNDDSAMFQWKEINQPIGVGDGNVAFAKKEGKVHLEVHQRNGKRCTIVLSSCKYVPELRSNLFSITTALA
jgi:hypothetical protein